MQITEEIAQRLLEVVDAGLTKGLGKPIPGGMCVESAICYAVGLPHRDDPDCVAPCLRELSICLNDLLWFDDKTRAQGLRRLALAQLGSVGINERLFTEKLAIVVDRWSPGFYSSLSEEELIDISPFIFEDMVQSISVKAVDATCQYLQGARRYGKFTPEYSKKLAEFAEEVVQILISMDAPGTKWL